MKTITADLDKMGLARQQGAPPEKSNTHTPSKSQPWGKSELPASGNSSHLFDGDYEGVIEDRDTANGNVAYISKIFAHSLIPYRPTSETFTSVPIQHWHYEMFAGAAGMPYGRYPRLALAYIITQALYNKKSLEKGQISEKDALRIPLGNSNRELFKAMGLNELKGGHAARSVQDQIARLATVKIQKVNILKLPQHIDYESEPTVDVSLRARIFNIEEAKRGQAHVSFMVLTKPFFDMITEKPIPIDLEVYRKIKSPRAMDLYCWILVKRFWIKKKGYGQYGFEWRFLADPFAKTELDTPRRRADFRAEMRKCISQIEEAWPDMGVTIDRNGITISNGELAVSQKS